MPEDCGICGNEIDGPSHNGSPVTDQRVCGDCNAIYVIPARQG